MRIFSMHYSTYLQLVEMHSHEALSHKFATSKWMMRVPVKHSINFVTRAGAGTVSTLLKSVIVPVKYCIEIHD